MVDKLIYTPIFKATKNQNVNLGERLIYRPLSYHW